MPLKAELHCHIEGAASPDLVIRQARKYGADPSPFIRDGAFVWHDFTSFLAAYDFSAGLFRSEEDYALLADHYLTALARDGAIYSEIFISPDHAARAGLSPKAYADALGEGIARAGARTGIEGRMIVVGLRHVGVVAMHPQTLPLTRDLVGRLSAFRSADVRARVPGVLVKRVYREGSDVKEGDLMFEIDPAPLKAALNASEATLAQAQATYTNNHIAAQRARELVPKGFVSKSDVDNAEAAERMVAGTARSMGVRVED